MNNVKYDMILPFRAEVQEKMGITLTYNQAAYLYFAHLKNIGDAVGVEAPEGLEAGLANLLTKAL